MPADAGAQVPPRALPRGIWDEIRRFHLDRAMRLLSEAELPMSSVATAAGFSNGKHLSVVFHQFLDTTLTAYRRQFRSNPIQGGSTRRQ